MSTKQTKRARFYASVRKLRALKAIHKKNRSNPNYLGAMTGLTLRFTDGRIVKIGAGALFLGDQ